MKSEAKDVIQLAVFEGLAWIFVAIVSVITLPFRRIVPAPSPA